MKRFSTTCSVYCWVTEKTPQTSDCGFSSEFLVEPPAERGHSPGFTSSLCQVTWESRESLRSQLLIPRFVNMLCQSWCFDFPVGKSWCCLAQTPGGNALSHRLRVPNLDRGWVQDEAGGGVKVEGGWGCVFVFSLERLSSFNHNKYSVKDDKCDICWERKPNFVLDFTDLIKNLMFLKDVLDSKRN